MYENAKEIQPLVLRLMKSLNTCQKKELEHIFYVLWGEINEIDSSLTVFRERISGLVYTLNE